MIISLDKYKNKGSGTGSNGKFVVPDGTLFHVSSWETVPEELDFNQVTNFIGMFAGSSLRYGLYLDDWSKVTFCNEMYYSCNNLESVPDMNTSNCVYFARMFENTPIVYAPNIEVSSAKEVAFMFNGCTNLQYIGKLDTGNVTEPIGFQQFCTFCPNLTTIESINFNGIVDPPYWQITDNYNGPVMFHQNDSLTNITVEGAISFSWANDYGFNALPNLSEDSVISILTAMSSCINPDVPKTMYFNYTSQDDTLRPLIEDCQSKGWTIEGIAVIDYPIVSIDYVPEEVEAGKDFEIQYTVHGGFDNYASQHDIILHVYDNYGYSEDFVLAESGTITLNDGNFREPTFYTIVKYGERNFDGSIYSYTRLKQEIEPDVDTAIWGNPDEAIPVTMAEFVAAEPVSINSDTGEVSNAQWYEITGKILSAGVENGKFNLQSIDGDCGQNINSFENSIFICSSNNNIAMMDPIGDGWDWFPGDYADIKIRTLKHNYDYYNHKDDELTESDHGKTIGGSYKGSPCAIYLATIGGASEPDNFPTEIIFNDAYAEYNADDDTVIIKYNINVEQENRPWPRLILYNEYDVEIGELPIDNYNNGEYNQIVVDRTDDMTPNLCIRVMCDFNGDSSIMAEAPVYIVGFPEPEPL